MATRGETSRTVAVAAVTVTAGLIAAGAVGLQMSDPSGRADTAAAAGVPDASGDPEADRSTGSDTGGVSDPTSKTAPPATDEADPAGTATEAERAAEIRDDFDLDTPRAETSAADDRLVVSTDGPAAVQVIDADLDIVLDDAGELAPGTSGVGTIQLPTDGPLAAAMLDRPLRGAIGVAFGRDLGHLGAHLRDDERYLYTDLGSQPFELFLDLDESHDGTDALPQRISTEGIGGASMFIAALDGDYFYISTPCAALIPADAASSPRPDRQRSNDHAAAPASQIPGVSADLTSFDPGGCGLGWSIEGNVPFVPILGDRGITIPEGFGAHVVIDGTIPVHPSATLDGELFYRLEDDHASVWANGELDVGIAFVEGAAEVNVPAIRGTFGLELTPTRLDLAITATAGSSASEGAPSELLADLAPIRGRVDVDGQLTIVDGDVLDTSFLELSGDISISPTPVRAASDVPVDDVFSADALVRIDRTGVMAQGSVAVSPVSALSLAGDGRLEFLVPFADANDAYLEVAGALRLGDTRLGGDALLRIDRTGALARGRVDLAGFGGLDVEGRLGVDGFQLTGTAEAVLPVGDLDQVAANLVDETSSAETLRALNAQIDKRVNEIGATDAAKGAELRTTIGDLRTAFDDIAAVRDTIAYNDGLIADLWRDHQADIDWHWALNDFDRFWDKGPHAIRLAAIIVEIEALKLANTVQYGYIDVANLAVSAAQQTVIAIIGWDAELNALLSLQTEAYLGTLTGN
ncbi:MAG: hypothetical protein AB8G26_04195, partial [Ilumatobacter sp.]